MTYARAVLMTASVLALAACQVEIDRESEADTGMETREEPAAPPADSPAGTASADPAQAAQADPADVCSISVEALWQPPGVEPLTLTARSRCEGDRIIVERKVFDSGGHELFAASYPVSEVMTLVEHHWFDAPLEPLVEAWLEPDTWRTSTAELPAYDDPSEFPFMPALSEVGYEAARAAAYPMHCYVQGMESSLCLALVDGTIVTMGVQRFPG